MTPLLGTKNPSALVGAKSGGDGRAARSLLSCVLWRGMGRLWRGMGGGRPPHRQHGLSGFHETRNTALVAVRFSVGVRGVAPQETAIQTTAPTGKSRFPGSPLFTIVHHCSAKNIAPEPVSPLRPHRQHGLFGFHETRDTAFVVARHGAAMERHGRRPSPAPATRVYAFHKIRDTNHGLWGTEALQSFFRPEAGLG